MRKESSFLIKYPLRNTQSMPSPNLDMCLSSNHSNVRSNGTPRIPVTLNPSWSRDTRLKELPLSMIKPCQVSQSDSTLEQSQTRSSKRQSPIMMVPIPSVMWPMVNMLPKHMWMILQPNSRWSNHRLDYRSHTGILR